MKISRVTPGAIYADAAGKVRRSLLAIEASTADGGPAQAVYQESGNTKRMALGDFAAWAHARVGNCNRMAPGRGNRAQQLRAQAERLFNSSTSSSTSSAA